jgi:hypothetical protein
VQWLAKYCENETYLVVEVWGEWGKLAVLEIMQCQEANASEWLLPHCEWTEKHLVVFDVRDFIATHF